MTEMATLREISDAAAALVDTAAKGVVAVDGRGGSPASGIVWADGLVLTSAHVLQQEEGITISDGGDALPATLVGQDGGADLALLRVEGLKAPVAARGDR